MLTSVFQFSSEGQSPEGHEGHREGQRDETDGGRGRVHQGQEVGRGAGEAAVGLLRVLRRGRRAVSRTHNLGDRKFLSQPGNLLLFKKATERQWSNECCAPLLRSQPGFYFYPKGRINQNATDYQMDSSPSWHKVVG